MYDAEHNPENGSAARKQILQKKMADPQVAIEYVVKFADENMATSKGKHCKPVNWAEWDQKFGHNTFDTTGKKDIPFEKNSSSFGWKA
eukprot:9611311-Alexandrium_andersonii.AAC.1